MNQDTTRNNWAEKIVIPGFEQAYPGIKVRLVTAPWAEHDSKLLALTAAGTPPDVFSHWGQNGAAGFYRLGLLQPMDELIQRYGWDLKGIPQPLQSRWVFEGRLYGIPMYVLGTYVFYNKDMFDQAGVPYPPSDWEDPTWTWDELLSRAMKLTRNIDDPSKTQYGFVAGMPDLYGGVPWLFGAEIFSESDIKQARVTSVDFTSSEWVSAIQAKADLINYQHMSPNPGALDTLTGGGVPLATGRVAMHYDGGWNFFPLRELKTLKWGVAAVPRKKTNRAPTSSDAWYVAKGSKDQEAAFSLVKYLTTGPGQREIAVTLGAPPADQSLLDAWANSFPGVDSDSLRTVQRGALAHGDETPSLLVDRYTEVEDIYNQLMTSVWNGERPAVDGLREVETRVNDALKKSV